MRAYSVVVIIGINNYAKASKLVCETKEATIQARCLFCVPECHAISSDQAYPVDVEGKGGFPSCKSVGLKKKFELSTCGHSNRFKLILPLCSTLPLVCSAYRGPNERSPGWRRRLLPGSSRESGAKGPVPKQLRIHAEDSGHRYRTSTARHQNGGEGGTTVSKIKPPRRALCTSYRERFLCFFLAMTRQGVARLFCRLRLFPFSFSLVLSLPLHNVEFTVHLTQKGQTLKSIDLSLSLAPPMPEDRSDCCAMGPILNTLNQQGCPQGNIDLLALWD